MKQYWLVKSEPDSYSIDDLKRDKMTLWDGVRNYQARNFMRDQMKRGDPVFFYHSNAEPSGIAGIAEVVKEGCVEASALDPQHAYFDADSRKEKPTWYTVNMGFKKKFAHLLPLERLRKVKGLENMLLLQRGQRLSVQPVTAEEWKIIMELVSQAEGTGIPVPLHKLNYG